MRSRYACDREDLDAAKSDSSSMFWTAMAAESQLDYELWVQALSTRKVTLRKSLAENFGLLLDSDATVVGLLAEPDGEPGPAARARQQMRAPDGARARPRSTSSSRVGPGARRARRACSSTPLPSRQ